MRPKAESVVFVVALIASVAVALLIVRPAASPRSSAGAPSRPVVECGLSAADVRLTVSPSCTSAPASPSGTPSASSAPPAPSTPSPSPTSSARAAVPCLASFHLPSRAKVGASLRIPVRAGASCFGGPARTASLRLQRTTGHHRHVDVRWTSGTGPHDVVLAHGVPTSGRWELVIVRGSGLSVLSSGSLVAHR